jgi:hypothetical protein
MHKLAGVGGVRLEGLVNRRQFLAAGAKAETTLAVEVNVYGKRAVASKAGEILSSAGVYLQQPVCDMEHTAYYNPHFLHVEEMLGLGPVQETPKFNIVMEPVASDGGMESSGFATPEGEQGDTFEEISNVLGSLSHRAILSKKTGAVALKSELKE